MSFGLTQYDVEDLIRYSKNCCELLVVWANLSMPCSVVSNHMSCSFTRRNRSPIPAFPVS